MYMIGSALELEYYRTDHNVVDELVNEIGSTLQTDCINIEAWLYSKGYGKLVSVLYLGMEFQ